MVYDSIKIYIMIRTHIDVKSYLVKHVKIYFNMFFSIQLHEHDMFLLYQVNWQFEIFLEFLS